MRTLLSVALRRGQVVERTANDAGVALLSAIFFMVLAAGLSVALLGAILSQSAPALIAQKNTRTVYSAQAGIQTALGLIRSAADASGNGTPAKLPCTVTGRVAASGPGASYSVSVDYYIDDPTNQTPAWRSNTANKMPCTASGGVTGIGSAAIPNYAYVYSGGKDAPTGAFTPGQGERAISAVYKFKVSNVNIPGGMIYNDNKQYCLEADGVSTNSTVSFKRVTASYCTNNDLQRWIYDDDYQIKLASTVIPASPGVTANSGKCITGPVSGSGNLNAVLLPCLASPARWNQLWSWTGQYSWEGQQSSISGGRSGYCLSTGSANGTVLTGKLLVRNGCQGQFSPSSSVGAGAASYATGQIVNYLEFGRCADVTDETITRPYMISYPCKQDPSGGAAADGIKWNHKWFYSEPTAPATISAAQEIYVLKDNDVSQKFCLTAPAATPPLGELTFKTCNSGTAQKWTRVSDTGDYATSYLIKDNTGRCMFVDTTVIHPGTADIHKIRVKGCDGSLAEKWNAPAIYVNSTVGSYREVAN